MRASGSAGIFGFLSCLIAARTVDRDVPLAATSKPNHVCSPFPSHVTHSAQHLFLFVVAVLQFSLAVVLLRVLHTLRLINLAPLRWDMVKLWMPVNLIFVLMVSVRPLAESVSDVNEIV